MQNTAISLSELQARIANRIKTPDLKDLWVRCEISELNEKGHVYLELTENVANSMVAKQRATIWKSKSKQIFDKFHAGSGIAFQKNIGALLQVTVEFHALYGMSLVVNDIDPSYTVGQLELKIRAIKDELVKRGCFKQNHHFKLPKYFSKVAVITPSGSAGEGDFKKDADKLEKHGICSFTYYHATMQGMQAEESLSQQIAKVNIDHKQFGFDVIVIIRGGGASADLSWLNNFKSALYICKSLIPVMTGLGHERDTCVLDEVACVNSGTPSKTIEHITKANISHINKLSLKVEKIHSHFDKLVESKETCTANYTNAFRVAFLGSVSRSAHSLISKELAANRLFRTVIRNKTTQSKKIQQMLPKVFINAFSRNFNMHLNYPKSFSGYLRQKIKSKQQRLIEIKEHLRTSLTTVPVRAFKKLSHQISQSKDLTSNTLERIAKKQNEFDSNSRLLFIKILASTTVSVINKSDSLRRTTLTNFANKEVSIDEKQQQLILIQPLKVLERGYAIVRDTDGKLIKNSCDALNAKALQIDFNDKSVKAITTGETNARRTDAIK